MLAMSRDPKTCKRPNRRKLMKNRRKRKGQGAATGDDGDGSPQSALVLVASFFSSPPPFLSFSAQAQAHAHEHKHQCPSVARRFPDLKTEEATSKRHMREEALVALNQSSAKGEAVAGICAIKLLRGVAVRWLATPSSPFVTTKKKGAARVHPPILDMAY